jgi:hypothetical protein
VLVRVCASCEDIDGSALFTIVDQGFGDKVRIVYVEPVPCNRLECYAPEFAGPAGQHPIDEGMNQ